MGVIPCAVRGCWDPVEGLSVVGGAVTQPRPTIWIMRRAQLTARRQGGVTIEGMGPTSASALRLAAATILVAAGSACSGTGDVSSSSLPPLSATFSCEAPIDVVGEPPASYSIIADVVALPGADDVLQRGRIGPDNDAGSRRAFSKMGLPVRPSTTFQIHVAPDRQPNTLIQWVNVGENEPVGSIAVDSCTGDVDEWLVYPGGAWTLGPACVELIVLTAEATDEVRLPLGVACT